MSVSFYASALSGDQIARAFPLIQASWPDADLPAWQRFVRFFADAPEERASGVLGIYDAAGYICGVFAYRLDCDLRRGRILTIELFTAVDIINSLRPITVALELADSRARELGCTGVRLLLPNDQAKLASRVIATGLSSEARAYWKPVDTFEAQN